MNSIVRRATGPGKIRVGAVGARQLVGIWAPAFAEQVARHGFKYAAASLQELVSHPEVDLVLVLTHAFRHEEGIRAAIEAGKDVYCEWPLTPTTALSNELLALARKAGVRTVVGL